MTLRPDPLNLARYIETVEASGFRYDRSVNPFHIRDGAWSFRAFADRPMNAANYGSTSPFKRKDTGSSNIIVHEAKFEGIFPPGDELNTQLDAMADPDKMTVTDTVGGGTTDVLARVADPAGSGRKVWRMQWDCSKLWAQPDSGDASSAGTTGRRRGELRHSTSALLPYGTPVWCITSLYLDPAIDWASMTAGDYIHDFQWHDTTYNGSNAPGLNGCVAAGGSNFGGNNPNPPPTFYMQRALITVNNGTVRWNLANPPIGKWIYTVVNLAEGGSNPFCKVWHVEEGKAPLKIIDFTGDWGWPDDLGTEYAKCGPYSPGTYLGTVPVRRYWFDGLVVLRSDMVPDMTPERMVACLKEQPGF